jgi:uracil-DNA glycosylase
LDIYQALFVRDTIFVDMNNDSSMKLAKIQTQIDGCQQCLEAGYSIEGPPIYSGDGHARLMLVGQAPGVVEVREKHLPFSGSAGARLFRWLAEAGWSEAEFRQRFYITSCTKCFPGTNRSGRGDRAPSRAEQRLCGEWLDAEMILVDPEVLVPVGKMAIDRIFGRGRKLVDLVGNRFQIDGRIVVPLPHPSGASAWIQKPEHRVLIQQALGQLAQVRQELNL